MKKIIKKITAILIASVLAFGMVLVTPAQAACADSTPVMVVVEQVTDGSGWTKNLTTQSGRTLQFELQIHNTVTGSQAIGVRAQAVLPSGTSTSFNVPALVSAQNAGGAGDSVTINIPNGGSIAYVPGSTRLTWSPDGNGTYPYNNSPIQDGITTGSLPAFGDQSGCTNFIIRVDFLATVYGNSVVVPPTYQPPTYQPPVVVPPTVVTPIIIPPGPAPVGGTQTQTQTNTQSQGQSQSQSQSVNVTNSVTNTVNNPAAPAQVVYAGAPAAKSTPATGVDIVTLAGMFGAGPAGLLMTRYGGTMRAFGKIEEDWMSVAKDEFLKRKIKKLV